MLPALLLLLVGGSLVALGSGPGPASKSPPVKLLPVTLTGKLLSSGSGKTPPPPTLDQAQQSVAVMRAMLFQIVARSLVSMAHRPDPHGQPSDLSAWLNANGGNPVKVFPEFGWYANDGSDGHPETLWRAHYDLSSNDHVQWWSNRDGSWGYSHEWGGVSFGSVVGAIVSAIQSVVSMIQGAVRTVTDNAVVNLVPWQDVADYIEAATSTIPVLGTAVADVVATGEMMLALAKGGENALQEALQSAYEYALASTPGAAVIRPVTDPVVDALLRMATGGETASAATLNALLDQAPDDPNIGGVTPRSIAASLAAILARALNVTL